MVNKLVDALNRQHSPILPNTTHITYQSHNIWGELLPRSCPSYNGWLHRVQTWRQVNVLIYHNVFPPPLCLPSPCLSSTTLPPVTCHLPTDTNNKCNRYLLFQMDGKHTREYSKNSKPHIRFTFCCGASNVHFKDNNSRLSIIPRPLWEYWLTEVRYKLSCALLTAHCSLLTAHCSLLTAHC